MNYSLIALLVVVCSAIIFRIQCETNAPKLILISFDGFRADYVKPELTPNLYNLSKQGVTGKMKSLFVTKTFPNHFSIVTGLYEETHGIVGNEMYDPQFNETFEWSNTQSKWWDNGFSLPIWIANELQNDGKSRFSGSDMWPGSSARIRKRLPHYLQKFDRKLDWQKRIDTVLSWMTDASEPANFISIYFNEPDQTAHHHGPFSPETLHQVSRCDKIIGYLILKLREHKLLNIVNFIILSDHGMAKVMPKNIIELNKFLSPELYLMSGTSPVHNILPKNGSEELVFSILKNASLHNHFNVYKREEVPFEYHYRHNRRILSIVIVGDEGWEIVDKIPSHWNLSTSWGNHGYNNSLLSMRPLFIAKGPAFKSNYVHELEFENIDLYPLMCFVLHLFPLKRFASNGSFERVFQMLVPVTFHRTVTSSEKIFVVIFAIGSGFLFTFLGGLCLVVCLTFGKKKPRVFIELDGEINCIEKEAYFNNKKEKDAKTSLEETVLLLDSDCDEV
ncbi:ectonucleotide pyrophosphatase/phosphodiesterase family member 5-like protein [Dinothrombium tinctorium]|uniref:Ectonucleotide pyrophosphatase/phosphodiesterase family member 5-like protein n=1 Tax=Dinothrombium tinctorium TaxID=1965070 RepID=A0A3S4R3I8_9ACAR|nr:ectonucleotide pyrophosphatase/phosphodiesterase family member 5-like protein [Dinothrombium tinctorium]